MQRPPNYFSSPSINQNKNHGGGGLGGGGGLLSDMFHRMISTTTSPMMMMSSNPSSKTMTTANAPSTSSSSSAVASSRVKTILNRSNMSLADKIHEINCVLMPAEHQRTSYSSHSYSSSSSSGFMSLHNNQSQQQQQQALSIKDLDAVFVLLVGDIFGSHAVQASKYGQGWNLPGLSRQRNYRDFHAVLDFLGSSGTLLHCVHILMSDPSCVYEYPAIRLPSCARTSSSSSAKTNFGLLRSPAEIAMDSMNESVTLTPFEYYVYHFVGLINQSSEWYQNCLVDNDSLYPILFEDYLSSYLPIGGAHFKFQPAETSSFCQAQFSPVKSSLLRSDVQLVGGGAPGGLLSPKTGGGAGGGSSIGFPNVSAETWLSYAFLSAVTRFWLQGWIEEGREHRQAPRIPSSDVVRMIRMFIKHLHFFFNSFHPAHAEIVDSLRHGFFREFFESLFGLLEFLFDHWPLDASFRLVLEIWLSYIQPWRYRTTSGASGNNNNNNSNNEAGTFQSGPWDKFIAENADFYNGLFHKIVTRFFRLDISSSKNAFMLFRVAKVFSQDGFFPVLTRILVNNFADRGGMRPSTMTPFAALNNSFSRDDEFGHIFDENFQDVMTEMVTKVSSARSSLEQRRRSITLSATSKARQSSTLARVVAYLFLEQSEPNSEVDEIDRTIKNLDFTSTKLCQIFSLGVDLDELASNLTATDGRGGGGVSGRGLNHDDATEMTPQKRWEIVNRLSKYSPKYHGNPDETPLRTDEFHFLARCLHSVSGILNDQLAVSQFYEREGLVGSCLRQICQPPTTFRVRVSGGDATSCRGGGGGASFQFVNLPARIVLRPLASYKFVFYAFLFLFLGWMLGKMRVAKIVFACFTLWAVKLILGVVVDKVRSNGDGGGGGGTMEEDESERSPM